jgi:hypothetical protein
MTMTVTMSEPKSIRANLTEMDLTRIFSSSSSSTSSRMPLEKNVIAVAIGGQVLQNSTSANPI